MVNKIKNKKISFLEYLYFPFMSLFKLDFYEKANFSKKSLALFVLINLLAIGFLNLVKTVIFPYSNLNYYEAFFYVPIALFILFLIYYLIYFVILNSFKETKKKFCNSFLVFLLIFFPYIFVGNLIVLLKNLFLFNSYVNFFFLLVLVIFFIYFLYATIKSLKNYYSVSLFQIISSLMLSDVVIVIMYILIYALYLSFLSPLSMY